MPLDERQQFGSEAGAASAGPVSVLVAPHLPNQLWATFPPNDACGALCCKKGGWWVQYHLALDDYQGGPSQESLDGWGCWKAVQLGVSRRAAEMLALGLAPWGRLSPEVRARFRQWTPVAKKLWESDFDDHRKAMVRAWIWHYLDDNFFSFSPSPGAGELVKCASPVWEHVRLLRRDLDVLRLPRTAGFDDPLYRIQFHAWSRMTEHLVRKGLGLNDFVEPADIVPHFKSSLRLLLADGETALPDHPMDMDGDNTGGGCHVTDLCHDEVLKGLLRDAGVVQFYIHGMFGSYALRFSPIGSDKLSGFPFDEEWMAATLGNPREIPGNRPGKASLPPVKLVSDPMLVVSGLDGQSYGKDFTVWTRMQVVTPWLYSEKAAEKLGLPGFEKGWKERLAKEQNGAELGGGSGQDDRESEENRDAKDAPDTSLAAENKGVKRKGQAKKAKKTVKRARKATKKTKK